MFSVTEYAALMVLRGRICSGSVVMAKQIVRITLDQGANSL